MSCPIIRQGVLLFDVFKIILIVIPGYPGELQF